MALYVNLKRMLDKIQKIISTIMLDKKKKISGALILCAATLAICLIVSKEKKPDKDIPIISIK